MIPFSEFGFKDDGWHQYVDPEILVGKEIVEAGEDLDQYSA